MKNDEKNAKFRGFPAPPEKNCKIMNYLLATAPGMR